jgi:hypothetical protein
MGSINRYQNPLIIDKKDLIQYTHIIYGVK